MGSLYLSEMIGTTPAEAAVDAIGLEGSP